MNKNNIIGFVLIGLIMFGFSWYQSRQYREQAEAQAQLDSIARVEDGCDGHGLYEQGAGNCA
jgi:YidC/Oxa1 family membrane protein insertase